ncbi:MAG: cell division protein FtsZ [Saprospiraceae bacterium]|nr:cell division protein FtsZ [Saprospiraceae bacterium]
MIFDLPKEDRSIIKVIGVGGGGCNAVAHMYKQGIVGVDFVITNTDNQALELNPVPVKIQMGPYLTDGRGAGSKPEVGKEACEESIEDIRAILEEDTKMVFITAGMGGGTGTGAAPIIARLSREMGILTVGIVTVPFTFEGRRRNEQAKNGLEEMKASVDAIVVISNDKLREIHGNLPLSHAFSNADDILSIAAKGIAEIITVPGYVNVDFEDVNTVMRESGVAIMGTAVAEGEDRARKAVDGALNSPLLEDNDIRGAKHILLNITSGNSEVTMDEIFEITEYVQEEAGYGTDLIWGHCHDETLGDKISVTIIATGFEHKTRKVVQEIPEKVMVALDEKQAEEKVFEVEHPAKEELNTIEFDHVEDVYDKYQKNRYSYEEPFVKDEAEAKRDEMRERFSRQEAERRERLRKMNVKLTNPKSVVDLESKPAYQRRNVELDDVPHSSDNPRSKWILTDDNEPRIREENSFLHDNVD